jgi:hypothetical protein
MINDAIIFHVVGIIFHIVILNNYFSSSELFEWR